MSIALLEAHDADPRARSAPARPREHVLLSRLSERGEPRSLAGARDPLADHRLLALRRSDESVIVVEHADVAPPDRLLAFGGRTRGTGRVPRSNRHARLAHDLGLPRARAVGTRAVRAAPVVVGQSARAGTAADPAPVRCLYGSCRLGVCDRRRAQERVDRLRRTVSHAASTSTRPKPSAVLLPSPSSSAQSSSQRAGALQRTASQPSMHAMRPRRSPTCQ